MEIKKIANVHKANITLGHNNKEPKGSMQHKQIDILKFFNESKKKQRNELEIKNKFGLKYPQTYDRLLRSLVKEELITPPEKFMYYESDKQYETVCYELEVKGEKLLENKYSQWLSEPGNQFKIIYPILGFIIGYILKLLLH